MAKEKQYVFSARTTEEGLKALNEVKARLSMGWDDLVIEAVSARYELDKAMMTLPRKEKPTKEAPTTAQQLEVEAISEVSPTEEKTKKKSKKR